MIFEEPIIGQTRIHFTLYISVQTATLQANMLLDSTPAWLQIPCKEEVQAALRVESDASYASYHVSLWNFFGFYNT